ncbi:hypothetical protein M9C83_01260 [SAR86 cluster bacterium]|nr:hypothetical protein M9C83_01260 [SAR86 cluster bacterium]
MLSANQLLRNTGNLFPIQVSFFIAASFGLYLAVLSLSNEEMNNGTSILIATSGGLIAIFFFYFMLQKYFVVSILKYALLFYLIRLSIGIVHYLIFLEPDYFRHSSSDFSYLDEYMWLFDSMDMFAAGTAGTADADTVAGYAAENKNYEMIYLMSFLFYFGGVKALSVATFNSLVTVYAAFLIYFISLKINENSRNAIFCFLIVLLQPFEMITSILSRDTFGQMLVLYSVFLLVFFFSSNGLFKIVIIGFASWVSSLVREVYFLIPLIVGIGTNIVYSVIYNFRNFKKSNLIAFIFALIGLVALTPILIEIFLGRFLNVDFLSKIIALPVSFIYSVVGPFPWTQVLYQVTGYEYHIPGYLTSVFNLTLFLSLLIFLVNIRPSRSQFMILLIFSLFYLSGILVYGGKHTVYYSIAVPLLALFDSNSRIFIFFSRFIMVFIFFLILNFIYLSR